MRKFKAMTLLAAGSMALGTIAGVAIAGASAASGTVKHYKTVQRNFTVDTNHTRVVDVKCPRGYVPVGGGGHAGASAWPNYGPAYAGISASDVDLTGRGWSVTAFVTAAQGNTDFTASAVCATP